MTDLNTIPEIIEDLKQGKMVIIMDDEDRENEGDLIMAASLVCPEDINFMARYARGLICLTLTQERCRQLRLPLMVNNNNSAHSTNFTLSIEAAQGVTTGISAADRATTVQAAVSKEAKPEDIVQPGHIFPLMAQPGGVLTRAGHTEAGCDLTRLAGLEPASVIVEILNEDGSMARRPDLEKFAQKHDLKIGTIADLIRYRTEHEKQVEAVLEKPFYSEFGEFRLVAYQDIIERHVHLALVSGEIKEDEPVTVRVHLENPLCDLLMAKKVCGWPLQSALERIAKEKPGVLILLRSNDNDHDLISKIERLHFQEEEKSPNLRTYGVGAQILTDLGVHKMRILSSPKRFYGLSGFDLEVVEYLDK